MKARPSFVLPLIIGALVCLAAQPAEAVIRIYKVTFNGKAMIFPTKSGNTLGRNFTHTGYLIYDTNAPGNSETIKLFKNKTYERNGAMLQDIFPSQIAFGTLDKNNDTFVDTEVSVVAFTAGAVNARGYIGTVPKAGFRVGAITVFGTSRSLKGRGAIAVQGFDHFTITDTWTYDNISVTGNPANVAAGVALVQARLQLLKYTQVP